jgi:flagellar biosynthesis protein FlhB
MSEKTEQPTPRRLRKALERGDSPVSPALVQSVSLLVAVLLAPALAAATATLSGKRLVAAIHGAPPPAPLGVAADVLLLLAPLSTCAALGALVAGLVQTGGHVAWQRATPDLERLNPIAGFRNLLKPERFVAIGRALVAGTIVLAIGASLLRDNAAALAHSVGNVGGAAALGAALTRKLLWLTALVALGLAAVDLVVTRHAWLKRNMMSKDEVRREQREAEGDPELKAARRRAHHELLASAIIARVREATVVVVNPTHLATALHYENDDADSDAAPRVVAQGKGDLAHRMIEAAHAYGVPVVRDVPLAQALAELEIDDQIPEALYEAVAEVLREIWSVDTGG